MWVGEAAGGVGWASTGGGGMPGETEPGGGPREGGDFPPRLWFERGLVKRHHFFHHFFHFFGRVISIFFFWDSIVDSLLSRSTNGWGRRSTSPVPRFGPMKETNRADPKNHALP